MNEKYLEDIYDFFGRLRESEKAVIKFRKKDGSLRIMNCTLNFKMIPKDKRPKEINVPKIIKQVRKDKILRVFDLDNLEWRSIPFDRMEWVDFIENENNKEIINRFFRKELKNVFI